MGSFGISEGNITRKENTHTHTHTQNRLLTTIASSKD